jgi:hypothetical protein
VFSNYKNGRYFLKFFPVGWEFQMVGYCISGCVLCLAEQLGTQIICASNISILNALWLKLNRSCLFIY